MGNPPSPTLMKLAAAIRRHRKRAGLTQLQLANMIPCSDKTLSAIETVGPIIVGFTLYHERYPRGGSGVLLALGLLLALVGLAAFNVRRAEPADTADGGKPGAIGGGDWVRPSVGSAGRPGPSRRGTPGSIPDPPGEPSR